MNFAKWVLRGAGVLGLFLIVPFYFTEAQIGRDLPPAITHPEYYYGFLGVTLAWQIAFLIMSTDPLRYRPLLLAALVEKGSYVIAVCWLFALGRIPTVVLGAGVMDLILGLLLVAAYVATAPSRTANKTKAPWQAPLSTTQS